MMAFIIISWLISLDLLCYGGFFTRDSVLTLQSCTELQEQSKQEGEKIYVNIKAYVPPLVLCVQESTIKSSPGSQNVP